MADSLTDRLAELETSSTAELGARWEQAFKRSAPNRASRDLAAQLDTVFEDVQMSGRPRS